MVAAAFEPRAGGGTEPGVPAGSSAWSDASP